MMRHLTLGICLQVASCLSATNNPAHAAAAAASTAMPSAAADVKSADADLKGAAAAQAGAPVSIFQPQALAWEQVVTQLATEVAVFKNEYYAAIVSALQERLALENALRANTSLLPELKPIIYEYISPGTTPLDALKAVTTPERIERTNKFLEHVKKQIVQIWHHAFAIPVKFSRILNSFEDARDLLAAMGSRYPGHDGLGWQFNLAETYKLRVKVVSPKGHLEGYKDMEIGGSGSQFFFQYRLENESIVIYVASIEPWHDVKSVCERVDNLDVQGMTASEFELKKFRQFPPPDLRRRNYVLQNIDEHLMPRSLSALVVQRRTIVALPEAWWQPLEAAQQNTPEGLWHEIHRVTRSISQEAPIWCALIPTIRARQANGAH